MCARNREDESKEIDGGIRRVTCGGCKFAYFRDYGWSNWTTEGTEFFCLLKQHPCDGFDRWYGEDKRLEYANECPKFTPGDPIEDDVDLETEHTPEEVALLSAWDGHSTGTVGKDGNWIPLNESPNRTS